MLDNVELTVPPISLYYRIKGIVYKIESGAGYDVERFLIGKNAITGEFYARSLVFRRGNALVLANFVNTKKVSKKLCDKEFLHTLGNMFLKVSKEYGDNISYVLISNSVFDLENNYISNKKLQKSILHCDMSEEFSLIATNRGEIDINIDENVEAFYTASSQNIVKKSKDYIEDIKRIRALQIMYYPEMDNLKRNFNNINNNYRTVYIGQDFYIAVDENYNIESIKLPVKDKRQNEEIDECISDIINMQTDSKIETVQEKYTMSI